jgi:6-pyruvoyltetrahydropterin/6-carboxytetrahydropterin synthase
MFKVVREMHFCYGHRLRDYSGKCRHPHGHNGKAEIELSSHSLDARGMVMDFDDIKRTLQTWIDQNFDHQMLLRRDDPLVKVFRDMNEPVYLMDANPTSENIAREIFLAGKSQKLPITRVTVWETDKSFATYTDD